MLNKRELKKIKKALPDRGVKEISDITGYKPGSIYQTLNYPNRYNKIIIDAALKVIELSKSRLANQKSKIKAITE